MTRSRSLRFARHVSTVTACVAGSVRVATLVSKHVTYIPRSSERSERCVVILSLLLCAEADALMVSGTSSLKENDRDVVGGPSVAREKRIFV